MNETFRVIILTLVATLTIYLSYENDKLRRQLEQGPTTEQCLSVCVEEFNRYGC